MGIADSTHRSGSGAFAAGANAEIARQRNNMEAQQLKRDNYLKQYESSKQQLFASLSAARKSIDNRFLLAKREAGDDQMKINAANKNYEKVLNDFKSQAAKLIDSNIQSTTMPMMQLGYLPQGQAQNDATAFKQIFDQLRPDEQAFIDSLPDAAKARAIADATNEMVNMIGPKNERDSVPVTDTATIRKYQKAGYQKQSPVNIGVQGAKLSDISTQEERGLRDAEIAYLDMVGEIENIRNITSKGAKGGALGDITRNAANAKAFVSNILPSLGITDETSGSMDLDKYFPTLSKNGVLDQSLSNSILSLAFMVAASEGQTGKALSDKDMDRVLKRIGDSSDVNQLYASMDQELARASRRLANKKKVLLGEEPKKEEVNPYESMSQKELEAAIKDATLEELDKILEVLEKRK